MDAIRASADCFAAGRVLAAGTVYAVPADVPSDVAAELVRMGRAIATAVEVPPPTRKRKDAAA